MQCDMAHLNEENQTLKFQVITEQATRVRDVFCQLWGERGWSNEFLLNFPYRSNYRFVDKPGSTPRVSTITNFHNFYFPGI